MHDSTTIEGLGVAAVAVATHVFQTAARAQAAALGRPDYEAVYVPHPIQDQNPAEIAARADEVLPEIVGRLVGAAEVRPPAKPT